MTTRPHLLLFNPDTYRGDVLGHLGNRAAVTPHLDRWVRTDAVSFRHAFCQSPICGPSRCSFMTGWYPHVRGHRLGSYLLRADEPVLLRTLKEAGYYVWWGGKNDLVPGQHGYDAYCDVRYRPDRPPRPMWAIDRQREWRGEPGGDSYYSFYVGRLETRGEAVYADRDWAWVRGAIDLIRDPPTDQPLCIYLPLDYPHPPYAVEEPWYSLIDREKLPPPIPPPAAGAGTPSLLRRIRERQGLGGWTAGRWAELRATYYRMCARVDHQFGLVLDALKDAGIYDDTAIFFFSDHGDFTGDYGLVEKAENTFADCLTRVPLLVKPQRGVPIRPRVSDALVELIDLPATVEALTGVDPRHTHFGRSLLPLLAGAEEAGRDAVFCEGGRLRGEPQWLGMDERSRDDLYWPRLGLRQRGGAEYTKAVMVRTRDHKYVRRLYEEDELYDLRADPTEERNRIADPALAGVLAGLKERLLTFYLETGDVVPHDHDRRN